MKVAVVGLKKCLIEKHISRHGLKKDSKKPDSVICFGGDGTLLYGELKYPSIPKLFIKHDSECKICEKHDFSRIMKYLANGNYSIVEMMKLNATVNNNLRLIGMNEINIHYKPPRALRFDLYLNNKMIVKNVIGDGVVVATPFGSAAYFKSITRKVFRNGIGIAFNNLITREKSLIVKDDSIIKIKILRGPGILAADNNKRTISLKVGDVIVIKKNNKSSKIIKLNGYDIKVERY